MSIVDHRTKISIVKALIFAEDLKSKSTIWGREIKLLNQLLKKYDDLGFWTKLNLGYQLHSLAFFKTERGSEELKTAYIRFKIIKIETKNLDNIVKPNNISLKEFDQSHLDGIGKKETQLDWIEKK